MARWPATTSAHVAMIDVRTASVPGTHIWGTTRADPCISSPTAVTANPSSRMMWFSRSPGCSTSSMVECLSGEPPAGHIDGWT